MTESGSRFAARLRRRRRIGSNSAERHRRLRRQHPAPIPVVPTVAAIATPGNLVDWFYRLRDEGGQAAGPDHVTYSMLSRREVWDICRSASELLLAGDSVVSTVRRVNIPKRSGHGLRPISIRSIVARVVEAALNGAMAPFWESVFTGASFGFRPGRGVWDMFLALEDAIDKGYSVIAPDDIFHAFDELPIEAIMAAHRRHIQDEQLLNLIESVLRGINDPQRAKGIDQGSPYSPAALNVLLHAALDTQVCQHVGNPLLHRYADNIVFVCRSVSDGGNAIGHTQEGLSVYGLRLKEIGRAHV